MTTESTRPTGSSGLCLALSDPTESPTGLPVRIRLEKPNPHRRSELTLPSRATSRELQQAFGS